MMTLAGLHAVLDDVHPGPGLKIRCDVDESPNLPGSYWLQVVNGDPEANGRKWRISQHSTRSEVVQTALKAVLTWHEHEAREKFLYRGEPIFSPHFDVDDLYALATRGRFDVRS